MIASGLPPVLGMANIVAEMYTPDSGNSTPERRADDFETNLQCTHPGLEQGFRALFDHLKILGTRSSKHWNNPEMNSNRAVIQALQNVVRLLEQQG